MEKSGPNEKNHKSSLTLQTPGFVELFIESEQRRLELILAHKSTAKPEQIYN